MLKEIKISLVPDERIETKIFFIRGKKVMFDRDLAELYGVETRALNQAVKRNIERFPEEFMFQLNKKETEIWQSQVLTSQTVISSWGGRRKVPLVFTEPGVAMLSSVLNSKKAIQVNIQIIKTFIKLREMIAGNKDLRIKIEELEKKYNKYFKAIFETLKSFSEDKKDQDKKIPNKIGFLR
ncbi:ORF6N domain-containing protein [Patescibacteria group bacterium]|nr:ORF6N domain-containing protein [Patescibacteria group bacterium]MBU4580483.1 ORF6N domain-containing protein [Patescibacteria group bacterium]